MIDHGDGDVDVDMCADLFCDVCVIGYYDRLYERQGCWEFGQYGLGREARKGERTCLVGCSQGLSSEL